MFIAPQKDRVQEGGFIAPEKDRVSSPAPEPTQPGGFRQFVQNAVRNGPVSAVKDAVLRNPKAVTDQLPLAGAVAGGLAGSGLASIPLAGLGAAGGEAVRQLVNRGMGLPAPETSGESALSIGKEGLKGVASEAAGLAVKPVLAGARAVGRGLSKLGSAASGAEATALQRVAREPSTMLPSFLGGPKGLNKAGEAIGAAEQESGLAIKESADRIFDRMGEAKKIAKEAYTKHAKGELITATEALETRRALDDVIPSLKRAAGAKKEYRAAVEFKKQMNDILSTQAGKFQAASREYARSILRSDLVKFLPVNKDGTYSIARTGLVNALNYIVGLPMPVGLVASSPLAQATAAAGLGAAYKGVEAVLNNDVTRRYALKTMADVLGTEIEKHNGSFGQIIKRAKQKKGRS